MTEFYLADALQEISPELVMEATLPLRRKKRSPLLAFAACFALVTVCSFAVSHMGMGGSDAAAPEMNESVTEGIQDSMMESSTAEEEYVVYDSSHYELVSFDLQEMYARADTVVIGRYTGDFTQHEESFVGIHLYSFTVEETVKGNARNTIKIQLPVWRRISGDIEGDRYSFVASDATFFDPTEDGQVMLFLQDTGNGIYRKAQEPFTIAIDADWSTELHSNLLLPLETREELASTVTETESGRTLIYTDNTLLQYNGSGFSGIQINDLLEFFGSDLRIID